jgi:hypothetical protein
MKTLKTKLKILLSTLLLLCALFVPATALAAECKTSATPSSPATQTAIDKCLESNPIVYRLNQVINFLSVGVGIVITGVIIVGGIQYILAGDNATALAAARQRIINGLIALGSFLLMYSFLQWLIPGGVFG